MSTLRELFPTRWRPAALLIVLASLAACGGGGGYGGGGGNTPVAGVGASKLFAADSTDRVIGSLANPDPATGALTVDRLVGPQPGAVPYNYAQLSTNIGSLALDTTRDILYAGNGTSVIVFYGASMANGDIFASATIGPIGNTGSLFVDTTNNRLYVGDDVNGVKVFNGASTANNAALTPNRSITGNFGGSFLIHGVAVDTTPKNLLYVSNTVGGSTHQISVFNNADTVDGSTAPLHTIVPHTTVDLPAGGIFLDAANDRLYVAAGASSTLIMVFENASAANGPTAPTKTLTMTSGMLNVVVDMVHDRLYAVGFNGHVYLIEAVSTLPSGVATAKDASLPGGGMLTAVAVNPN